MKFIKKSFYIIATIVACTLFLTCEIGLGQSVDTEAPSIEFSTPTADFIVRDNFKISGTYNDDGPISEVSIILKRTDDKNKQYGPFEATFMSENATETGKGNWSCSINVLDENKNTKISDGTYEAIVTIKDGGGHSTKMSRQFSIDNTPPVIVLSSPNSKDIDNPTSYGSVLSVDGKAADDSDVDSMDFILYAENGTELARKTITSVSTQIELDITQWGDEFYEKIYGTDKNAGTKSYYIGFEAFDGARKIPEDPSASDPKDRGNSTTSVYFSTDFAELEGFKTSIAYNLLNRKQEQTGNYSTWLTLLEEKKIQKATISLNPVNNPYFELGSYEALPEESFSFTAENSVYTFMNKNKLTVNLFVGLDKQPIKKETIGIYLKACDDNGIIYSEENPNAKTVTLLAPYKNKDGTLTGNPDRTNKITSVGSTSYKWESGQLDANEDPYDNFDIGSNYIVDVVAYDYNGIGIYNENRYGFRVTSTSSAPTISVDALNAIGKTGSSLEIGGSESFFIAGHITASSELKDFIIKNGETPITELNFDNLQTVTQKTNSEINSKLSETPKTSWIYKNSEKSTSQMPWYNYCVVIPAGTNNSETFNINMITHDTSGQNANKEIEVRNDVEAPQFGDYTISPYVDIKQANGTYVQKVNGKVSIKQLLSDNNSIQNAWYSLDNGTTWKDGVGTNTMNFEVDTTKFTDNAEKYIHLKAVDKAGNTKVTGDSKLGTDKITLIVDQSTDAPDISLSNANTTIPVSPSSEQLKNISVFGTSANYYILGTITDDDGIASIKVEYSTNGTNWEELDVENKASLSANTPTTFNLKAKLPGTEGKYQIRITVKDKYADDGSYPRTGYATKTIGPFLVAVDNGAPELTIKTASGTDQYKASTFEITGTLDDKNAIIKAYTDETFTTLAPTNKVTITLGTWDYTNKRYNWNATINGGTEPTTKTYYLQAEDEFGQKTGKSYTFSVDPVAPKFKITSLQGENVTDTEYGYKGEAGGHSGDYLIVNKFGNTTEYFTVKGEVKDVQKNAETPSGVNGRYFYYYVGKAAPTITNEHYTPATIDNGEFKTTTGWNTCTIKQTQISGKDIFTWEAPISFEEFQNNDDLQVYFAVMDNAGNYSKVAENPSSILKIKIDEIAPTIGNPTLVLGDGTDASGVVAEISVVAKDDESGLDIDSSKVISILRNGVKFTPSIPVSKLSGDYNYEGNTWTNVNDAGKGKFNKYQLKITAADVVTGKNEFTLNVKDNAGNEKTSESKVTINNDAPIINARLSGLGNAKDDSEFAYVNEQFTSTAEIQGIIANTNKLKSVSWKDTYLDGETTKTLASGDALKYGTPNIIEVVTTAPISGGEYENKQITRTITATNIFGSNSEWSYKFRFDVTAPNLSSSNVDGKSSAEVANAWFNKNTLNLAGIYTENGTGINKITYDLNGTSGSIYTTVGTGTNVGKETFNSVLSGFKESTSSNTLKFIATDKAGNSSTEQIFNINIDTTPAKLIEYVAPEAAAESTKKTIWYKLAGETEWLPYDAYILTDGVKSIELTGSYLDKNTTDETTKTYKQSGVQSIEISVGSNKVTASLQEDKCSGRWTATVTKDDLLKGLSGTATARIKVQDNAGNVDETTSFTFRVDTQAPTVILDSPSAIIATNGVNGEIEISGRVTDGLSNPNGVDGSLKEINLYYSIADQVSSNVNAPSNASDWYKFNSDDSQSCSTSSETFSVKHEFSTQNKLLNVVGGKLQLATDETTPIQYVWIKVQAKDSAGHTTELTRKVKVDRDTDRPIIRFINPNSLENMSLSNPIWLKNTGTIIGMISDDDSDSSAIVKSFEYKVDDESWTEIDLSGNNSFTFDVTDGAHKIYFRIKDNNNTVFESGKTQSLQEVKFTDGTNNINSSVVLNMKIDKTSPKINTTNIKYDVFDSTANGGTGAYKGTFERDSSKYSYGGNNNKLKLQVPTSDENSIVSVTATITKNGLEGNPTVSVEGTCDDAIHTDSLEHTWTINDISLEGTIEQATIVIKVVDGAGLYSEEKIILPVDNTAPKISVSAPKVGTISSDTVTAYGTITELCSELKYAITTDTSDVHPNLNGSTKATTWNGYSVSESGDMTPLTAAQKKAINYAVTYQPIVNSSLSWYIYFNGEQATDNETNSAKLENWLDEDHLGITTQADLTKQTGAFDKIVDLYLWIYAKDNAGNESYTKHLLKVDPQGGRPSVTIDYPDAGSSLGGTIRLSGSAEDNQEVKSVWVQVISGVHAADYSGGLSSFGSGSFNESDDSVTAFTLKAADLTYMKNAGYEVYKISNEDTLTPWNGSGTATEYAIKANLSGSSWNLKINKNNELRPNTGTNNVYIRVYALDNDNKWSYTTTKYFKIDASSPVISDVMLKQYSNETSIAAILGKTATPVAEKEYVPGDFLNGRDGKWYITFNAEDDGSIGTVNMIDEGNHETTLVAGTHYKHSSNKEIYVAYPLTPTGDVCSWKFTIKVNDTNDPANYSTQSFELNYDNLAPKLRRPGSNTSLYDISPTIKQNNGFYTFKSQVDESSASGTQSGLKAVAFYFMRRNTVNNTNYIMDPMQVRTGNVLLGNAVYDSGLYWLERNISRDTNNTNTFTYTSSSADDEKSIHIGGLVKIAGGLYTIIDISGNTIIVDKNIPPTGKAKFALGMVVDTAVEKTSGSINTTDGYYDTWTAGDGDRMYEAIGGTTAQPTWEAQISSKNIPDGTAELHYVAFDKAGNYSIGIVGNKNWNTYKAYTTSDAQEVKNKTPGTTGDYVDFAYFYNENDPCYVKNNAPRISMVTIGCDYDGNGTIEDTPTTKEKNSYYYSKITGKDAAGGVTDNFIVDSGAGAFMKLTDKTSIEMEIIGGNGNLFYSYDITRASGGNLIGQNENSFATGNNYMEESEYLINKEIVLDESHIKTIDISLNDFKNYLGKGSGSGSANTAFIPNNAENSYTTFKYTIWDSTDGTKKFLDSLNAKLTVKLDVQVHDMESPKIVVDKLTKDHYDPSTGHIDIKENLPTTLFNAGNGIFDDNPKVSGIIQVTGYAYDNIRLESLWLNVESFTNFTGLGSSTRSGYTNYVKVASYDSSSGTWTTSTGDGNKVWKFSVDTSTESGAYQNDTGHKVKWTLELDTSKVDNVAYLDRNIKLYAKDVRGTDGDTSSGLYSSDSENNTEGDKTYNKPFRRVDIVPYITGLNRVNVDTKRSKLGKYQVVIGESLTLQGFNLPTTNNGNNNGYFRATTGNVNASSPTTENRISATNLTSASVTLTAPARSGYIVAFTNGIASMNNMNIGNECAQEVMEEKDSAWNDDVYLNVWKNNEYFHFSNDPISPAMDRVPAKQVNNAYNANVNTIYGGWASNASKFYASYANSASFTDKTGNAPSPATGDSETSKSSQTFGDPATYYDVITDDSGNRYNVLLDCWQGSTDGWGKNFVINYNGYYRHNSCTTDNPNSKSTNTNTNLRHVIERMGSGGTTPDNANSSNGTDEMFNQFLNPRIAMYNGEAYITYYDRYAKCLKWAMAAPTNNRDNLPKKYATEGIYLDNKYEGNDMSAYYTNGGFIVAGYDTLQNNGTKSNLDVGRWSAIAIDTTSKAPIVAYYDSTNKQLWLATSNGSGSGVTGANSNAAKLSYPINSNTPVLTNNATSTNQGNAWNRVQVGDSKLRLGQYVSMVVDSQNNLHIACYGTGSGNALYYIKGTKTTYGNYTFETTCVDNNGAGTWTDIKLENNLPVISYYDPSNDSSEHAVKVAYFDGTQWDHMTCPLASSAVSDRITLALDITDGESLANATSNNSKLAIGYVSSRFECVYLRKE